MTRGISDQFATYGGPLVKNTIGPNGIGIDGSAKTSQSVRLNSVGRTTNGALNNIWDAPTSAATWIVLCERFGNNPNGNSPIFGNASAEYSPYTAWSIQDSGGSGGFQVECSAGGSYRSLTAGTIPNGVPIVLAGRYDGTKLEAFTNGVKYPSSTACTGSLVYPGGVSCLGGPAVGNFFNYATNGRSFNGRIYLALLSSFALTDTEIERISKNPWQIFQPREQQTFFSIGSGGNQAVSADLSLTYYIRAMLSSDSGVQYAIRNAIYRDDAVGYALRAAISANSAVGYVLRQAIAKDDPESYLIRGIAQSDDAEAYKIRGLVQTSDNETYSIRSSVQASVSTAYDVMSSATVAANNAVSYAVRGMASSDAVTGYTLRSAVAASESSAYSVRSAVSRDAVAGYEIAAAESSVYADSTVAYSVDAVGPSSPSAESTAAAVLAALQGTTIPVNVTKVHNVVLTGSGTPADPMRPA